MNIPSMITLAMMLGLGCSAQVIAEGTAPLTGVLDCTMTDIDGKPFPFSQLQGKVILLVNVASKCGNTPQYAGLEALYEKDKARGLVLVGIPANNFGHQEPGSNHTIKSFCMRAYHVTFPMLAKVSVKGPDICPLYDYLTTRSPRPGPITWNFAKFLVDRQGNVVDRFDPRTKPDDPALVAAVEKALGPAQP